MEHRRLFPNDEDERKNYFDTFGTSGEKRKNENKKLENKKRGLVEKTNGRQNAKEETSDIHHHHHYY